MYHIQRALKVPRSHPYKYIDPYYYGDEERNGSNCCASFFGHIVKGLIAISFLIGVIILFLWLFFRPFPMDVAVEAAQLTRFEMFKSMPPYINYNLTTVVSIQNPNGYIGVHYDWLEIDSYYEEARFDWTAMPTFYQKPGNSTVLRADVSGGTYFWLNSKGVNNYVNENKTDTFSVNLWLYGHVRYRFNMFTNRRRQLSVKCPVTLKVAQVGRPDPGFERTKCTVVRYWMTS
ncbi:hypothetical protein LUZ60_016028 [Juncus effusus]|nr:hypothetical protein LUZ60_016028 [Juncus effusus]